MSRISVIALSELAEMNVIEKIDTEEIIVARMNDLKTRWASYDPPAAAQYDVEGLEFDPIKINQEVSTYFELMLRDRVNQAARAVTLAFASNDDLDAIASRYPGGVPRIDGETDERYRRRVWLSPNMLSPHGIFEAYVFWALTADPTLRDATATSVRGSGNIKVTIMAEGANPTPTAAQLNAVMIYVESEARKGLTDVISVASPRITSCKYRIRVWLLPGFDQLGVMTKLNTAITNLIETQRWLGYDHTHVAISAAMYITGVYNIVIDEPAEDVLVADDGLVQVSDVKLTYIGRGE